MSALLIRGVPKHYSWGDTQMLPNLVGVAPDGRPWAELWFGTHIDGPSELVNPNSTSTSTPTNTSTNTSTLESIIGALSFLVKLISVAQPLSLQTHPTREQATRGFARENAQALARTAPNRIYRDADAKPELLCALGNFEALCGFRQLEASIASCDTNGWTELASRLRTNGLAATVRWALTTPNTTTPDNLPDYLRPLASLYPDEGGILVALLMNHVTLHPDEALYLQPGNVHMYLRGNAVEVMTASDNVIRAAFSHKHIAKDEFFSVAQLDESAPHLVASQTLAPGLHRYAVDSAPFCVEQITTTASTVHRPQHALEMLLCVDGGSSDLPRGQARVLQKGDELAIPASSQVFRIWSTR